MLLDARTKKGLSLRAVAEATDYQISASGLSKIERGEIRAVTRPVLKALASALSVPISRLAAAAGQDGPVPSEPFVLPAGADDLNARERRLVRDLVHTLLAAHRTEPR